MTLTYGDCPPVEVVVLHDWQRHAVYAKDGALIGYEETIRFLSAPSGPAADEPTVVE